MNNKINDYNVDIESARTQIVKIYLENKEAATIEDLKQIAAVYLKMASRYGEPLAEELAMIILNMKGE